MNTQTNNMNEAFSEYLEAFKPKLLWELGDFIAHREKVLKEEPEFADEIHKQFHEEMMIQLSLELANNFNTDPQTIALFLENFDLLKWTGDKK